MATLQTLPRAHRSYHGSSSDRLDPNRAERVEKMRIENANLKYRRDRMREKTRLNALRARGLAPQVSPDERARKMQTLRTEAEGQRIKIGTKHFYRSLQKTAGAKDAISANTRLTAIRDRAAAGQASELPYEHEYAGDNRLIPLTDAQQRQLRGPASRRNIDSLERDARLHRGIGRELAKEPDRLDLYDDAGNVDPSKLPRSIPYTDDDDTAIMTRLDQIRQEMEVGRQASNAGMTAPQFIERQELEAKALEAARLAQANSESVLEAQRHTNEMKETRTKGDIEKGAKEEEVRVKKEAASLLAGAKRRTDTDKYILDLSRLEVEIIQSMEYEHADTEALEDLLVKIQTKIKNLERSRADGETAGGAGGAEHGYTEEQINEALDELGVEATTEEVINYLKSNR